MKLRILLLIVFIVSNFGIIYAQKSYRKEIAQWRSGYESELKKDDGWLTLAGLFWLKDGMNTIGKGENYDIELTEDFAGDKFGEIVLENGRATLKVEKDVQALSENQRVTEIVLLSDANPKPTLIQTGNQSFYLLKREEKFAIRLKDKNYKLRKEFRGLRWFPVNSRYKITADFEAFAEAKEVLIPNNFGAGFKMKSPGVLKFKFAGKIYNLQPVESGGKLFIIFRDATSRTETYALGRFLYAEKPVNGKVILDFNKAENPPCAYTTFATCPIPPAQNRLPIAIRAGEKRYEK